MSKPVIFISAVSKELHSARDLVAKTLLSLGYEPKWQDIAPTETGPLPQVLRNWIDQSDAVIQLVGHRYGFAPKEPDADFGECSYTQLEALYARQQGKKVWCLILTPEHPTDLCADEASALRDLQDAYRAKVKSTAHLYYSTSTQDKTELLVRRIKDELAELRQEEQARQDQLQQSIDSTHQKVTDLRAEIMAGIHSLNQKAQSQPKLLLKPESWPKPAPFHNRAFPDQQNFVGRAALLSAMKQSLDAERNVALTQPVAMHGAGGIGKTRAAVEFARAHGSTYTLCLFLDAQSPEALRASLVEVARKLELTTDPQASADALVLLSLRLLRAVPTALVVADNADTPAALEAVRLLCHEPGGVRWLITTRLTDLGEEFAPQRVDLLDEPEGVQLLQKRGSKNDHQPGPDTDALAIALELGRLPLALQQAAAYVAHMRLSWTAYAKLLAENPAQALSHEAREMKDLPDSILRTYHISLQQLSPNPIELLEVAAHFAPAPIPEAVFLHKDDDGSRRSALVELADLSLLEWQAGKIEIHRAIALTVRLGLGQGEASRTRLEKACRLVTAFVPKDPRHPNEWSTWAVLRPHIEHLLACVGPAGASEKAYYWLLAVWPNYLQALGEYVTAEGFFRSAVVCSQHTLGTEHPNTLVCRNNLAAVLLNQGKPEEAEREQRAVLEIQERVLGAEHPQTLMSRMNLANVLALQGKHADAEKEHREVLQIKVRAMGAEHPDTLASRMNLANALQAQGKHAEAEQEHREVLRIKERTMGEEHPETLASRGNLANALQDQGNHAEAEHANRAVLEIQECVLGAEHPDTLGSRMNLAIALAAQEKHAEAEKELRTVLRIQERVLGADHPEVATSCYNLMLSLVRQHKLLEALIFSQQAEQVWTKALGPDHPDTKRAKAARERLEAALK